MLAGVEQSRGLRGCRHRSSAVHDEWKRRTRAVHLSLISATGSLPPRGGPKNCTVSDISPDNRSVFGEKVDMAVCRES